MSTKLMKHLVAFHLVDNHLSSSTRGGREVVDEVQEIAIIEPPVELSEDAGTAVQQSTAGGKEFSKQPFFRGLLQSALLRRPSSIQQRPAGLFNEPPSEQSEDTGISPPPSLELPDAVQSRMEFSRQHLRDQIDPPAAATIQRTEHEVIEQPNLLVPAGEDYLYLAQ